MQLMISILFDIDTLSLVSESREKYEAYRIKPSNIENELVNM